MRTVRNSMVKEAHFVLCSGSTSVEEALAQIVSGIPYMVILRSDGKYAVRSLYFEEESLQDTLLEIADLVGPAIRNMKLEKIPNLCEPCQPVGIDEKVDLAREKQESSPNEWTVVLDGLEVVGVLEQPRRGGMLGGTLTRLSGSEFVFDRDPKAPEKGGRICTACGEAFAYYALRETGGEDLQFVCPHCQRPQEIVECIAPNCQKWFAPPESRNEEGEVICPYCQSKQKRGAN
jgi:DNA-directed RNA polymerase subunit RPC12/RpoP